MKSNTWVAVVGFALGMGVSLAHAQATDAADVGELTITLMQDSDADTSEAVTRTIRLPDSASTAEASANGEGGLQRAEEARAQQEASAGGREDGFLFQAGMAEETEETREVFSRGGEEFNMPESVPDLPDPDMSDTSDTLGIPHAQETPNAPL